MIEEKGIGEEAREQQRFTELAIWPVFVGRAPNAKGVAKGGALGRWDGRSGQRGWLELPPWPELIESCCSDPFSIFFRHSREGGAIFDNPARREEKMCSDVQQICRSDSKATWFLHSAESIG